MLTSTDGNETFRINTENDYAKNKRNLILENLKFAKEDLEYENENHKLLHIDNNYTEHSNDHVLKHLITKNNSIGKSTYQSILSYGNKIHLIKKRLFILSETSTNNLSLEFDLFILKKKVYKVYPSLEDDLIKFIKENDMKVTNSNSVEQNVIIYFDFPPFIEKIYSLCKLSKEHFKIKIYNDKLKQIKNNNDFMNNTNKVVYCKIENKETKKIKEKEITNFINKKLGVKQDNFLSQINIIEQAKRLSKAKLILERPNHKESLSLKEINDNINKFRRKNSIERLRENKKYEKNISHDFFVPNAICPLKEIAQKKKINLNINFINDDYEEERKVNKSNILLTQNYKFTGNQNLKCELKINSSHQKKDLIAELDYKDCSNNKYSHKIKLNHNIKLEKINKSKTNQWLSLIPLFTLNQVNKKVNKSKLISQKVFEKFDDLSISKSNKEDPIHEISNIKYITQRNSFKSIELFTISKQRRSTIGNNTNIALLRKNEKHLTEMASVKSRVMSSQVITFKKNKEEDQSKLSTIKLTEKNISLLNYINLKLKHILDEKLFKILSDKNINDLFTIDKDYFSSISNDYIPLNDYHQEFLFFSFLSDYSSKILKEKYSKYDFKKFFISSFDNMKYQYAYENYFEKEEFTVYLMTILSLIEETDQKGSLFDEYYNSKTFSSLFFIDAFLFKNFILNRKIFDKTNIYIDLILSALGIDMRLSIESYYDYKIYFDKVYFNIDFKLKFSLLNKIMNLVNITQRFYGETIVDFNKVFGLNKNYFILIKELNISDIKLLSKQKITEIEAIYDRLFNYIRN